MANSTYGTTGLLATTVEHYIPTLEDNIFTSKAFLWALRQADRIKNFHGTKIVQPLMYAQSANVGAYADDDVFSISANTGISAAEFNFAQYRGTVHFTGIELAKNSGKEAILSLMEARMMQVEMTIAEEMNALFLGSSSTWHGINDIVDASDPSWGDFGGIDRPTYAYWRAYEDTTAAALSLAMMRTAYNTVSEGSDQPTNIFTTQAGFESYEELLQDNVRYEDTQMGDAGFQNLMYKGAPVTFDRDLASGMYFLNLKYITVAKLNDVWFKPTEFITPVDQDAIYKHLLLYGNLIASNCKRQGKLSALTDD